MGPDRCGECGDEFVWDSDAGSAVCLSCGTLQDSSQVVLDAHIEPEDNSKDHDTFSFYHRATLKSFRNAHGWDLAGQGSQPAAERNKIAMREFTAALVRRIGHPSLSRRTLFLFELAMERGHFRHGRTARLVAGASLAIALREDHKGATIKDIACLLAESHVCLARVFKSVASLLEVKLASIDPSWHLPALQKHLMSLLAGTSTTLPCSLVKILKSVRLSSAFRTAASLSDLVSRAGIAVNLPSPPTACAIYILALEAEVLDALPHCGELAKALGRRFEVSQEVVMRRYRTIYECVEEWANEIPWAESRNPSAKSCSTGKVAKRVGIARRLKDAVQYREGLWKAKLDAAKALYVPSVDTEIVSSSEMRVGSEIDMIQNDEVSAWKSSGPRKRQKTRNIDDVSHFLLFPLHAGPSEKSYTDRVPPLDAATHMLTSDASSFKHPPTRLQLLAAAKPVDDITDDELFGEGELDSFLRTADEREVLIQTCDWARAKDNGGESDNGETCVARPGRQCNIDRDSTSRMNTDALSRLLDDHCLSSWVQNSDKDDADDDNLVSNVFARQIMTPTEKFGAEKDEAGFEGIGTSLRTLSSIIDDEEEVLGPWRPLSPSDG